MGMDINIQIVYKGDLGFYPTIKPTSEAIVLARYSIFDKIIEESKLHPKNIPSGLDRSDLSNLILDGYFGITWFTEKELIDFLMKHDIECLNEDSEWLEVIKRLREMPQDRDPIAVMYFDN